MFDREPGSLFEGTCAAMARRDTDKQIDESLSASSLADDRDRPTIRLLRFCRVYA